MDKKIVSILIVLIIIEILISSKNLFEPKLTFKSTNETGLNEKFNNDYEFKFLNKNLKDKVEIYGKVDTKKIGEYKLKYVINLGIIKYTKIRNVKVVDNIPPVITLKGNIEQNICKDKEYIEEGYVAIDNDMANITDKVKIIKKDDNIIYTVSDSFKNKAIAIRKIIKKDVEQPVISLIGEKSYSIYLNNKYYEKGYTANDNCDGDLTKSVLVNNNINVNKLGTYKIIYTVTDSSGLMKTEERTIKVMQKPDNTWKTIYLTFDDGPSNITSSILNILKEEGIKATFFVTGKNQTYDYLINREANEGHTIGLHCFNHNYQEIYTSEDAYYNDLTKIDDKVYNLTGIRSKVIRFPGGSSNLVSKDYNVGIMTQLAISTAQKGYTYFDWNVGSTDTIAIGESAVYNNVISRLSSGSTSIVLMHDATNNYQTVNALRDIIKYGKEMGYSFDKITTSTPQIKHKIQN